MNRFKQWSIAVSVFGMSTYGMASALAADIAADQDVQNTQFISTSFRSLCNQPPDPASLNYYLNVLADGTRTPAEVHAAIATTCMAHSQADACRHVAGWSEFCPPRAN